MTRGFCYSRMDPGMLAGLGGGGVGCVDGLLDHNTLHFFRSPRQFAGTSLWVDMTSSILLVYTSKISFSTTLHSNHGTFDLVISALSLKPQFLRLFRGWITCFYNYHFRVVLSLRLLMTGTASEQYWTNRLPGCYMIRRLLWVKSWLFVALN